MKRISLHHVQIDVEGIKETLFLCVFYLSQIKMNLCEID